MAARLDGLRGYLTLGAVALGLGGAACAPNKIRIVKTPQSKLLELEPKPADCQLLITRSVVREGEQVVARLTYTGSNVTRQQVETDLRAQACKLGADTLLIEKEGYSGQGDSGVEVLAMALAQAATPTSGAPSAAGKRGKADHRESTGTCFAVDAVGSILTAEHVVHDATSIEVQFEGEDPISAAVLDRRPSTDVAVLKIERKATDFLPLKESRASTVGDRVFTFGFPVIELLGKEPKFTDGAVSALAGYEGARNLMQVTIPIQPGNSGGPVVTETGFAIGMVVSTASALPFLKATGALPQGLNWAVKSELAMAALEPPEAEPTATDRAGAVARARHAVCAVTAQH
jgi:S1-C subfamily serine protease